jgi:hypothetical protein
MFLEHSVLVNVLVPSMIGTPLAEKPSRRSKGLKARLPRAQETSSAHRLLPCQSMKALKAAAVWTPAEKETIEKLLMGIGGRLSIIRLTLKGGTSPRRVQILSHGI